MNSFHHDLPYGSQRAPVLARNVVATSQPVAAAAGLRMLTNGGNAMDAALATAIALTVVEPTSNGIGSDAFAIMWDGKQLHGLNASGRSPASWNADWYRANFAEMPLRGWHSVTVPGAVSSWVELSRRFAKLPFERLFEPAIEYARNGFLVSPITANAWQRSVEIFTGTEFASFRKSFAPNGRAPRAGETFVSPDHARTLESIARTRGESFYRGELAEKIAVAAKEEGGVMTLDDLATHRCDSVETISTTYHGRTLHEIPPNGQGIAALIALNILSNFDLPSIPVDSADSVHLQIEATKLALADAYRQVADLDHMKVTCAELLDRDYARERANLIDINRAGDPGCGEPRRGGTVYLTTADASGMMVSFIQSNYYGFGSGVVIPGTGIAMQNRGHGFVLDRGHPNELGPRKRPFHTIIPAFVTDEPGQPLMSFGVMGGHMQAQGHVQMMTRIFDYRQNPQAASDAPRWRVDGGRAVSIEPGFDPRVINELQRRGHEIRMGQASDFGGAQLIYKLEDGYFAASDHRKDGCAIGF
ncbi:MAG: gamma-glutamyltransferase family protein [Anaerolineae bacterium]|nr:gamma-glutamyltransferase family protein [Phycisphaerae bacterium]